MRVAFGPGRRLAAVRRLRGGSKKGVYRLSLDDGRSVIGYVWAAAENYWPAPRGPAADQEPFGEASGADLFEAGLMFFDVEWEHVFLRLRFGEHYRSLREDGLDEERLRFYRLAMHLSLIAGPLRLLDGDFPDRDPMLRIAEYNIGKALEFVR